MKRNQHDPKQQLLFGNDAVVSPPVAPIDTSKVYAIAESAPAQPGDRMDIASRKKHQREGKRVVARMPVPHPLAEAVAAGRFGYGEDGKSIRPSAEEVREITDSHAHNLIDLLHAIYSEALNPIAPRDDLLKEFKRKIDAYAEDFGARGAAQLEAYVRREVGLPRSKSWCR